MMGDSCGDCVIEIPRDNLPWCRRHIRMFLEHREELMDKKTLPDNAMRILLNDEKARAEKAEAALKTIHSLGMEELNQEKARAEKAESKLATACGALEELLHQNHHTIEEERWRIDEALKTIRGGQE